MTESRSTKKVSTSANRGEATQKISVNVTGDHNDGNVQIVPDYDYTPTTVVKNPDGPTVSSFTVWPSMELVSQYAPLLAAPLPDEIMTNVGRVIIHSALMETRIKNLTQALCNHNKTTHDTNGLSKYRKVVTRLQEESKFISGKAPVASSMICEASEKSRNLHKSRGNLAHGTINLETGNGEFYLVATSRHGEEKFTAASLQDIALQMCQVSFVLKASLDPDEPDVRRSLREKRFLRGFQASSRQNFPNHAKQQRQPQS